MTHILITGANRGIGLGFVRKYIEKNLNLTCTTREISGSKELLAFKEKYPDNMEIFELDLLKENAEVTLANFLAPTLSSVNDTTVSLVCLSILGCASNRLSPLII